MSKGPKFNKLSDKINTRDNLGINGVAASMQGELCPVINTVTPRAFYWPFMVWNYYDFFENSGIKEHTTKVFDEQFLKINDYYFVLSNLITENPDRYNLVGQDKTGTDLKNNPNGPFPFNREYFVTRFGGMQYYNAGCLTMGYTTETTKDNETLKMPHPTRTLGELMAKAFEAVIKNTEYYKKYRGKNTLVPRSVLQELGEVLTLDMRNFGECKRLLRESLFSPKDNIKLNNKYLIQSAEYAKFIYKTCPSFRGKSLAEFRLADMREVLFDYYSPAGACKYEHDHALDYIMMRWEVVVGRQYFTMALELIWKHLMKALEAPMSGSDWYRALVGTSNHKIQLDHNLEEYIDGCNYGFAEREKMISKGAGRTKNTKENIDTAILLLLSLYNRFNNRVDIDKVLLEYGDEISLASLIKLIEEYKEKSVGKFLQYIIEKWIIKQHKITALNKTIQGRDSFFFEEIEKGLYSRRAEPTPEFQGIRMVQLMQVMMDLDMLEI